MTVHFTARHFKASEHLQSLAIQSVEQLTSVFDGIISANIILDLHTHGTDREVVEISLTVHHDMLISKVESTEFEKGLALCIEKLERQLVRYKDHLHNGRHPHPKPEIN